MTSAKQIISPVDAVKAQHDGQALTLTNLSIDTNGRLLYARAETTRHDGSTQLVCRRGADGALRCEEIRTQSGRLLTDNITGSRILNAALDALSDGLTRRIERENRISALVSHENARAITSARSERLSAALRAVESAQLDVRVDAAEDALKTSTARVPLGIDPSVA